MRSVPAPWTGPGPAPAQLDLKEVPPRPEMQLERRPPGTNSNAGFFCTFFFGLQVSGTEEGRQGPMCGRITSAPQTCTDCDYYFGQWFSSDFLRIVANSPLFPGCLQSWIRNFFSTGSQRCRSVCNEPRECYCSLHFREPPSAQLRPRRPQGVYRD